MCSNYVNKAEECCFHCFSCHADVYPNWLQHFAFLIIKHDPPSPRVACIDTDMELMHKDLSLILVVSSQSHRFNLAKLFVFCFEWGKYVRPIKCLTGASEGKQSDIIYSWFIDGSCHYMPPEVGIIELNRAKSVLERLYWKTRNAGRNNTMIQTHLYSLKNKGSSKVPGLWFMEFNHIAPDCSPINPPTD